jgi:F-type H+-transporting ATPase subunit b
VTQPSTPSGRYLRALAAVLVLFVVVAGRAAMTAPLPDPAPAAAPAAAAGDAGAPQEQGDGGEADHAAEGAHSWAPTLWKMANFALLVGVLVYFLRSPIVGYLAGRGHTIRRGLVEARTLRDSGERQLSEVRAKLERLPADLDALRARGAAELEAERVRMKDATARERELLLDRTRKEIDLQFRLARRALKTHTADLAMRLARTRIEQAITSEDQTRLIERYSAGVGA